MNIFESHDNVYWFDETPHIPTGSPYDNFSLNPSKSLIAVRTVTISALQLAVYLGFKNIYLIGCDTSYKIPKNVIFEDDNKDLIKSIENNDENHFSSDYFGSGKRWHNPHVDKMISQYKEAYEVCKSKNINITNATVGGNLEVFPRVNYLELF
jgi:hypothetical protein